MNAAVGHLVEPPKRTSIPIAAPSAIGSPKIVAAAAPKVAPIKNAEGSDSPETAVNLYNEYHKKYDK